MPAHEYLWLRLIGARRLTQQVTWAYVEHKQRQLDELSRKAKARHETTQDGAGQNEDW